MSNEKAAVHVDGVYALGFQGLGNEAGNVFGPGQA